MIHVCLHNFIYFSVNSSSLYVDGQVQPYVVFGSVGPESVQDAVTPSVPTSSVVTSTITSGLLSTFLSGDQNVQSNSTAGGHICDLCDDTNDNHVHLSECKFFLI